MKQFKFFTTLALTLIISATGFSQTTAFTVLVAENQCAVVNNSGNSGTMDSLEVLTMPAHGTITASGNTSFTYCPDSGFLGQDYMTIYACSYGNGLFLGCDTMQVYLIVQVPCNMNVSIAPDSAVCPGGGRHYTAVATGGSSPYTYVWSSNSTGTGACELNAGQGLCVTVSDANGCSATSCSSNTQCTITVAIRFDTISCIGSQPGLTVLATGGTGPYTYYWATGDTTTTLCNLSYTGPNGGYYCVTVYDSLGCSGYNCYTYTGPGNCSFQYAQQSGSNQTVSYYGYYDSSYQLSSVSWDFGDGTNGNSLNPSHYYANVGTYDVIMTLYYTSGDSCSSEQYVYVYNDSINYYPYCQAYFYSYLSNDTVFFVDQSSYNISSWSWDFGDGTSSTLQNPFHLYNAPGPFNVCLTITDTNSVNGTTLCTSSWCQATSNTAVQDLQAYLFHGSTVTPGYPLYTDLDYYNNGTILMNGTVVYRYPVGTSFVYSSPSPTTVDAVNRLLSFNFNGLLPNSSGYIFVDLAADSSIALASLVYDTMWVNPVAGDVTPGDNVSTIVDSVVGSWDPNGKSVSPKGLGEKGYVDPSTPTVSYVIHFQNTGNGPANQVVIRDTISDNIDLTSVTVTYASFAHIAQVIGNELVVSFQNINLPDSGSSPLGSQGYINVRANLKPGLARGTQIFNTANIYFDANAPVVTNTVVTTLEGGTSGINKAGSLGFALLPNPASSEVLIRGEFSATATYEVEDMLGQQIQGGRISATGAKLNLADMNAGIYLVKVKSGDRTGAQRLVVVR